MENVPTSTEIYLHDNDTGIYHDIMNSDVALSLAVGTYDGRFSLRFSNATLASNNFEADATVRVFYTHGNHILNIRNNNVDKIEKVYLLNMLGQEIRNWTIENPSANNIQIPISNIGAGAYIVKLQTDKGERNTKIIVSGL